MEFIYALRNHIAYGKVRNQNGEFVEASLESIAAAVRNTMEIPDDIKSSIVNAPGEGSYPAASFTWLSFLVISPMPPSGRRSPISYGGCSAPANCNLPPLGYLALPKDIVSIKGDAIARIH